MPPATSSPMPTMPTSSFSWLPSNNLLVADRHKGARQRFAPRRVGLSEQQTIQRLRMLCTASGQFATWSSGVEACTVTDHSSFWLWHLPASPARQQHESSAPPAAACPTQHCALVGNRLLLQRCSSRFLVAHDFCSSRFLLAAPIRTGCQQQGSFQSLLLRKKRCIQPPPPPGAGRYLAVGTPFLLQRLSTFSARTL